MTKLGPTLLLALLMTPAAWAYDTQVEVTGKELPKELQGVGVEEHLGNTLDFNLQFQDEEGKTVPLGDFFKPGKPVLMAMGSKASGMTVAPAHATTWERMKKAGLSDE